ncbi:winged helix-turn-helix domain-containing protein, partial [Streptococcus pyogenes]
ICHEEKSILLTPKANQLLLFMVQHPNQTLSREEILTSVWSRDFVSDHSLTQAVSDLRKALSELGTEYKKLIVTRPKTGYVLEADV